MLSPGSRQDAEDVMQDVFVRAYGALRADEREVNIRAWLYRVAHNRCIDHLRRPTPPAAEIFEMSRKPLHDPIEEAQRREDLARLVEDVGRLPEQQRSALLMREIDGMSYADLADALDVTVPAVKSLLVRARVGLVESAEARDADCCEIRDDLMASYDKGVKASGRARKHMRSCAGCREYRTALRGMRRSFAALTPVGAGLFGSIAASVGLGGGGAAAGGAAAGGGGAAAAAAGGTLATATACKVAAVVCTAALTAGGAVEVGHKLKQRSAPAPQAAVAAAPATLSPTAPAPMPEQQMLHRAASAAPAAAAKPVETAKERKAKAKVKVEKSPGHHAPGRRADARQGHHADHRDARDDDARQDDHRRGRRRRGARRAGDEPEHAARRRVGDGPGHRRHAAERHDGAGGHAEHHHSRHDRDGRRRRPAVRALALAPPHRSSPREPRPRDAARPARAALRAVHDGRRPLDRARPLAGRLPDVDLRRHAGRGPRRPAPVAGDDLQGRVREPPARRRQGRDHAPARPRRAGR